MKETPASLGYRMPAEWEPHAATWLAWPYNIETWEGHLDGAEEAYVRLIEILTRGERVELCVPNEEVGEHVRRKLAPLEIPHERLRFHTIETGDVWFRDFGPLFVKRGGEVAWTKWRYNALGNKWADLLVGDEASGKMPIQDLPHFDAGIVLEGGSIDVNGSGFLLTTESCLLNPNRNPSLSKEDIEERLRNFLGVRNILWLSGGIEGDDTDGHVDDVARFVNARTIVTMVEESPEDANFAILQENFERLQSMRDEQGQAFQIVPLPMPQPLVIADRRMAASYANFYIANGVVAVPTYHQPSDKVALRTLQELFPGRRIVGIDCRELVYGYGALHCITQQQPV